MCTYLRAKVKIIYLSYLYTLSFHVKVLNYHAKVCVLPILPFSGHAYRQAGPPRALSRQDWAQTINTVNVYSTLSFA